MDPKNPSNGPIVSPQRLEETQRASHPERVDLADAGLRFEAGWVGPGSRGRAQESAWRGVVRSGNVDLAHAALKAGLRPWRPKAGWWTLPIHEAIEHGDPRMAIVLARAMTPEEVAAAHAGGRSLMFDVVEQWEKASDVAGELWEAWRGKGLGIDARHPGSGEGGTALMKACAMDGGQSGRSPVAALLKMGASPNERDRDGRSALHLLCAQAWKRSPMQSLLDDLRSAVEAGGDLSAVDARGMAPLDLARAARWDDAVKEWGPAEQAFKDRIGIDGGMDSQAREDGLALAELRRQGYKLSSPDGAAVQWDQALAGARAATAKPKPKPKRSL